MAVLVRSGRASIPSLRRALGAAGVPVEVAADDTPLVREPAVLPLLGALAVVVDAGIDDPHHDDYVGADRVEALLTSALGGLDATDVRSLTRAMRARDRATPARELVRRAVLEPESLEGLDGEPARRATRLAGLLAAARAALADGSTVEEVLWVLWDGSDWGRRLRQATQAGGQGARLAHRDLDAICALFENAARAEEQKGHTSVRSFVGDPALPGDPRRHPRRPRRPWRRRTPPHRTPVQGPGVAARGRRPGPGGRLAGPPPPGHPAARRPDRPRRAAAADHHPRAARRGAPAVLRRRDPRQAAAGRHRGRVPRGRRRAALALRARARARQRAGAPRRASPPAAVDGRPGGRAPPYPRRPRPARAAASRGRPPAEAAGRHRRPRPAGRGQRRPGDLVGAARAEPLRATGARGGRAADDVRERPRGAPHLPGAVVPPARGRRRGGQLHQPGLRQGRPRDRGADGQR